jgi:hypothetical protein
LYTVYQISKPLNKFRVILLGLSALIFIIVVYLTKDYIELNMISLHELMYMLVLFVMSIYVINLLYIPARKLALNIAQKANKLK